MAKTLRVRTRSGWVTKPAPDIPENRLTSEEVDDNFLAIETALETHVSDSFAHGVRSVGGSGSIVSSGGVHPIISINTASLLEAEIGNENTKLMTPLRVAQSFNSRHGNFGNFKIEYNAASDSLDFNYTG